MKEDKLYVQVAEVADKLVKASGQTDEQFAKDIKDNNNNSYWSNQGKTVTTRSDKYIYMAKLDGTNVLEERRLAYPTKVVAMCSELGYKCYGYYELNILSSDFLVDLLNEQQSNQGKTSAFFKKRLEVQVKKVVDLFSKKSSN